MINFIQKNIIVIVIIIFIILVFYFNNTKDDFNNIINIKSEFNNILMRVLFVTNQKCMTFASRSR
jgi:hypothetical protein